MIQVRSASSARRGAARRSGSSDVPDVPFRRFTTLARSGSGRARAGGCVCRVSVISRQRAPAGARGVLSNRVKQRKTSPLTFPTIATRDRKRFSSRRRDAEAIVPAEAGTRPRSIAVEGASIGNRVECRSKEHFVLCRREIWPNHLRVYRGIGLRKIHERTAMSLSENDDSSNSSFVDKRE